MGMISIGRYGKDVFSPAFMEDRWSDSTSFNLPFFQLLGFEPSNGSKSTNQERYNARACSCKLLFIGGLQYAEEERILH
jgi:hypothetical protein